MFRLAIILGLIGLAAATAIIVATGYSEIQQALAQAGWGILWTSLAHIIPMMCCVIGWRALMPGRKRPSLPFFLYILWLRVSVNNLLPVARIGGEVLAARAMMKHGIRKTLAIASTVVETTLSVVAVFIFNVTGAVLFVVHVGDKNIGWQLALGLLLSMPMIAALVYVQRVGFFGVLSKIFKLMFRDKFARFAGDAAQLDRAVHGMYRRRGRVLFCGFWQLAAWVVGTGEIWLALHYLGHELPLIQCYMIEALIQAASSAAFAVPGALGVQEAGFLLLGHALGLSPETSAALAVMRRCRDLILYVPGLVLWQIQEGRWLVMKKFNLE
jgi:putative membrane protein